MGDIVESVGIDSPTLKGDMGKVMFLGRKEHHKDLGL